MIRMAKLIKCFFVFIGFAISVVSLQAQGYEIKVQIPAYKDSTIIMGHYFAKPGAFYADDTVKLNKNGVGVFNKKKLLPRGIYIVLLPSKKYFDFILGSDQVFALAVDTADLANGIKVTGSEDNILFYEYRNMLSSRSSQANKFFERKKIAKLPEQRDSLTKAIDRINQEVTSYIGNLKEKHPDLYFVKFISSIEEVKIPDPPRDEKGKLLDSAFQYKYYRAHYFDNFNYADPELLRTPLYEQKLKSYVDNMVPPWPDSINVALDQILEKVQHNEELFRFILGTFYMKYGNSQIMGQDGIFVHLAERWYLPHATWIDSTTKAGIIKDISKLKYNLIGLVAPNIKLIEIPNDHFLLAKNDTALKRNVNVGYYINLHDIPAKFLILAFWEADCGHCKTIIPKLHEVYEKIRDLGVEVLAIHLIASEEGKMKWIDFVNEHNLTDWHNAWSPSSYAYKDLYNVYTTPTIYILDKDKKIIAKRIGAEQIEDFIRNELKIEKTTDNKK
jgi:thiol-disulfide isomerase/thioredoxin